MHFAQINTIFFHIPKFGGMTIIDLMLSNSLFPVEFKFHLKVLDFSNNVLDNNFKFTFVRNPWSRLVSHYFFQGPGAPEWPETSYSHLSNQLKVTRQYRIPSNNRFQKISFADFIKDYVCRTDLNNDDHNLEIRHPIHKRLLDKNGQLKIDFIGRNETYSEDLEILCEKLNLKNHNKIENKRRNTTDYRDYYDANLQGLVQEFYKDEIEFFDFEF